MPLQLLRATHHELDLSEVGVFKCVDELGPQIAGCPGVRGVMVLATCNRFEVYLDATAADVAESVLDVVAAAAGRCVHQGSELLQVTGEDEAVPHLMRVASGLSSAVVGEQEIRGQVRRAVELARGQATLSPALEQLTTAALTTARDVGRRTGLGRAGRSSVAVALDLAEELGMTWDDAYAVIAGTGSYAGVSLAQLRSRGCRSIAVHSASGRADGFAERHGVRAIPTGGMGQALLSADLVVACRGAGIHAITVETLAPIAAMRNGRQLVIIDLALQRDVEDGVAELPGVELVTLADVGRVVPAAAADDIELGEQIVQEHLAQYRARQGARVLSAEVVAVRRLAEEVLQREISQLPADGMVPVEQATRALHRLVGALIHVPTERAHAAGRAGRADEYRAALREVLGVEA